MESTVKDKQNLATVVMVGFMAAHQKMLKRAKLDNKTLIIERDGKPTRVKARDLWSIAGTKWWRKTYLIKSDSDGQLR